MTRSIAPPPPFSALVSYHFGPVASSSTTPPPTDTCTLSVFLSLSGRKSGSRFQYNSSSSRDATTDIPRILANNSGGKDRRRLIDPSPVASLPARHVDNASR